MADEWDEKAREFVSCPEVPDGTAHDRFCPFGWSNCRRSASCEMREDLAAAMRAIDTAAERRGIERAAKVLDKRGAASCERGSTDPSTGAFECRRADRGECNCYEFDEAAEEVRALAQPAGEKESIAEALGVDWNGRNIIP